MEQKTDKLYPSAPIENKKIDFEQKLEKNMMWIPSTIQLIMIKWWSVSSKTKTINQKRNIRNTKC